MGKKGFVEIIAKEQGITKAEAGRIYDAFVNAIPTAIAEEGKLTLKGIGTFEVRDRKEREHYNIATNSMVVAPAGKSLKFKLSSTLKNMFKS